MKYKINNYSTSDNEYGKPMSWADLPGDGEGMAGIICITKEPIKHPLNRDVLAVSFYDYPKGRKSNIMFTSDNPKHIDRYAAALKKVQDERIL